ncbi:tetratricopeptide repeat protein [Acidobacteriota bacterium]
MKELDTPPPHHPHPITKAAVDRALLDRAVTLTDRGNYTALKESFGIYERLFTSPSFRIEDKENQLQNAVLLTIRQKELGIKETCLNKAKDMVKTGSFLNDYEPFLQYIDYLPSEIKGTEKDIETNYPAVKRRLEWLKENISCMDLISEKIGKDDFYAYLYMSIMSAFTGHLRSREHINRFLESCPDTPLIRYKAAILLEPEKKKLESLVKDNPDFYEAYYFLGNASMKEKNIITAEKYFLKAYAQIPESPNITLSLANVSYWFEELIDSQRYFEETLIQIPEHREALLGKATCLGHLGKHKEALQVLRTILLLGHYYVGEAFYWIGWNQNELGQFKAALENAEEADKHLRKNTLLLTLLGQIHFNMDNLDESEKNFYEAHKLEPFFFEPAFCLGKIYSRKKNWLYTGYFFEMASKGAQNEEDGINKQIDDMVEATIDETRKQRYLSRKRRQLSQKILEKVTSYFNAGAGYFNAGQVKKAMELVQMSSTHSAFEERANQLMSRMK